MLTRVMPYHVVAAEATMAAASGNSQAVIEYLRRHPHLLNAPSIFQSKLIHIAAKAGHADLVATLIAAGADVNVLDYGGMRRTALHWACLNGRVRVVELLVEAGADPKAYGPGWQDLVSQRGCGKRIATDSPPPDPPTSVCTDSHCWLALLRPRWSAELHHKFPPRFQEVVRLVLLASHPRHDQSKAAAMPLSHDICADIFDRLAYPISAWLD